MVTRKSSSVKPKAKGPSQRQLRMAEQIRHLLCEALQQGHFRDPVLQNAGAITITSVDISPDMKNAHAYIMPLGGKNSKETLDALNKASGYFRTAVGRHLEIRFIPLIAFRLDNTFDEADRINRLLSSELKRTKNSEAEQSEEE